MNTDTAFLGCTSMVLWEKSITQTVRLVSSAGFDTVEIWADHLFRTEETPADIRTSPGLYLRSLQITKELHALFFVFHAGNMFSAFDPLPEYWEKLRRALLRVLKANNSYLLVVVENMEVDKSEEVAKTGKDLIHLLEQFPSRETGICWDLTHLITTDNNLRFLETVPRIDHVHLSDCLSLENKPPQKHLRLGDGNLDLSRLLKHPLARQARIVSLETVMIDPGLDELISERRKMAEFLESTEDE